jgi:exopolyphosphatase/guanosine-5'-triphosphate,3'-diphosphate pyrophosphatase
VASGLAGQECAGRGRDGQWWSPPRGPVYAALDLGTNNCRLLIARPASDGFKVIDAFSRIVRLGEGLGHKDARSETRLSEAAVQRTLEALRVCAHKMRRRGVTHARNVATEACRRAANGATFLARVAQETGLELEVISPDEEARLAMAGCMSLLDPAVPHALLFDIGGGSTELIWLEMAPSDDDGAPAARMRACLSLPVGVVSFAERYGGRRVGGDAYAAMVEEVAVALEGFDADHGIGEAVADGRVQMLGTSGTVTTIAGVHLELPRYDRTAVDGTYLPFEVMHATTGRLRGMSYEERVAHPCVGPERADLVIAGLAILDGICRRWPVGRLRVADRGLREGILLGLMKRSHARRI